MYLSDIFQTANFAIFTRGNQRTKSNHINSKDDSASSHAFWNDVLPALNSFANLTHTLETIREHLASLGKSGIEQTLSRKRQYFPHNPQGDRTSCLYLPCPDQRFHAIPMPTQMALAVLDDAEADPIIRRLHKRMIARFLNEAFEPFRKSLNLLLSLGGTCARGIEPVFEGLNMLGITLLVSAPRAQTDMMFGRLPKRPYRPDIDLKE
jgi:hypothetical protein